MSGSFNVSALAGAAGVQAARNVQNTLEAVVSQSQVSSTGTAFSLFDVSARSPIRFPTEGGAIMLLGANYTATPYELVLGSFTSSGVMAANRQLLLPTPADLSLYVRSLGRPQVAIESTAPLYFDVTITDFYDSGAFRRTIVTSAGAALTALAAGVPAASGFYLAGVVGTDDEITPQSVSTFRFTCTTMDFANDVHVWVVKPIG